MAILHKWLTVIAKFLEIVSLTVLTSCKVAVEKYYRDKPFTANRFLYQNCISKSIIPRECRLITGMGRQTAVRNVFIAV